MTTARTPPTAASHGKGAGAGVAPGRTGATGATGKRKLSDRFEELEECRKRGFVTEEEYKQKRAMLLAAF